MLEENPPLDDQPATDPARLEEKRQVQIVLTAQQPQAPETCPSAERIAAFSEQRLDEGQRDELLAHLDACPVCYRHWLEMTAYLDKKAEPLHKKNRQMGRQISWKWGGPPLALAAGLLLAIWYWPKSVGDVDQFLAGTYQMALKSDQASNLKAFSNHYSLPWQAGVLAFGFGASGIDTPPQRAFGRGLLSGRNTFKSGIKLENKEKDLPKNH